MAGPRITAIRRFCAAAAAAACAVFLAPVGVVYSDVGEARSREATPAPPGGFAPIAGARGRASAYYERDGRPIDMKNPWRPLGEDGLHDPKSDAVNRLQQPQEALSPLPRAGLGNFVDWVAALKQGSIAPRAETDRPGEADVYRLDVTLRDTRSMPTVTFSHAVHTEWLDCGSCHDVLFKKEAGSTEISMRGIFKGETCGACHGTVAFPPDQCFRCHDGPRRAANK